MGSGSDGCCCWRRRRKRRRIVVAAVVERSWKLKRRFLDLLCLVSRVRWLVASLLPRLLLGFERSHRPRKGGKVRMRESELELEGEGERTGGASLRLDSVRTE